MKAWPAASFQTKLTSKIVVFLMLICKIFTVNPPHTEHSSPTAISAIAPQLIPMTNSVSLTSFGIFFC